MEINYSKKTSHEQIGKNCIFLLCGITMHTIQHVLLYISYFN